MGKQRRVRQKLHLPATDKKEPSTTTNETTFPTAPLKLSPEKNIFANVDLASGLEKNPSWDTETVKSFKSVKSDKAGDKALKKKEKLQLRREHLLRKIDTVNQMKKEAKLRSKRKSTPVLGDTNPLHDALPSLEHLLRTRAAKRAPNAAKPRGVQKAGKRQKNVVQGVQIYKRILSNGTFKKDPLAAISEHVKAIVEQENSKQKC